MVEMRTQLAIERAGLVTLHLQPARRSSIPTVDRGLGPIIPSLFVCIDPANSAGRDKSQNQRGRNTKEDIFTNPLAQGHKVQ
jgi:hypothetical protein